MHAPHEHCATRPGSRSCSVKCKGKPAKPPYTCRQNGSFWQSSQRDSHEGTQQEAPAIGNMNRRPSPSHSCFMLVAQHCIGGRLLKHGRRGTKTSSIRQPRCCRRCNHTAWGVGTRARRGLRSTAVTANTHGPGIRVPTASTRYKAPTHEYKFNGNWAGVVCRKPCTTRWTQTVSNRASTGGEG